LIKITKWIPPQAKRTSAWDRGESKYGLAQIIKTKFGTPDHTHNERDDDDDDDEEDDCADDANPYNNHDNEGDNGMDARVIPDGEPVRSWAEASEAQPTLPSSLRQHGPAAGDGAGNASGPKPSRINNNKLDELMAMIHEADKRHDEKIAETRRNMEEQVSQLSDGLAKVQDVLTQLAESQVNVKNARAIELAQIDERFTNQHNELHKNGKELASITVMLAKMQTSMDALACRMPDDNPAKARAVGAGTD
jgi:hypothetical protein